MRIFQSKTLLNDSADFALFTKLFGKAVLENSAEPFLLVRDDDARLLIVADDGNVMLCLARAPNDCFVSYASSYMEGTRVFRGLSSTCNAKDECFIEPSFAIKAIHAFFEDKRLTDHVDFRYGVPDSEITTFPSPIADSKNVERQLVEISIDVNAELREEMKEVCEYLEEAANDPDENIDFDDAIQIGSLCGGRIDRRRDIYLFSYHLRNGDVWSFKVPRTVLDGIADGSVVKLTVMASIPKQTPENRS